MPLIWHASFVALIAAAPTWEAKLATFLIWAGLMIVA